MEKEAKKQTKTQLFREILRFLLVGGTATLIDYGVAYVFLHFLLPPSRVGNAAALIVSTAFGFGAGLVLNWILSVKFVFRNVRDERAAKSKKSFLLFAAIGIVGFLLTEVGVYLGATYLPLVTLFGTETFLNESWTWWISKAAMTLIVLVWNYLGRKLFIFK